MQDVEQHEMELATTHASGAEEWFCPTCGRRFLMTWPPQYSKIILEPGNESVSHSGGKGGLKMGIAQTSTPEKALEGREPAVSGGSETDEAIVKLLRNAGLDHLL